MPQIQYNNNAFFNSTNPSFPQTSAVIKIQNTINIFAYKYVYSESGYSNINGQDLGGDAPNNGAHIGFSLIFGNYGSTPYSATRPVPTIQDTLDLTGISGAGLQFGNICAPQNMRVLVVAMDGFPITPFVLGQAPNQNYLFQGGHTYTLEVQSSNTGNEPDYTSYFCIPCQSVCCISLLFEVVFNGCIGSLVNGAFDINNICSLDGWTTLSVAPAGITGGPGFVEVLQSYDFGDGVIINAIPDTCFALLKSGKNAYPTAIAQTFFVEAGQTLQFNAFFHLGDAPDWPDYASAVVVRDGDGNILGNLNHTAHYISTDWEPYEVTFDYCGLITLEISVVDHNSTLGEAPNGYIAINNVQLV